MSQIALMFVFAILTAVMSSAMTLLVLWWLYRRRAQKPLEAKLNQVADVIQQRVREGVTEAGEELMPDFRRNVALGFQDAVTTMSTPQGMAKTGADIVEEGLSVLFGRRNPTK